MKLLPFFLLWSQVQTAGPPGLKVRIVQWLYVFGEPGVTDNGNGPIIGGLITWIKVVSLFTLLAWMFAWVISAYKARIKTRTDWLDVAGLIALLGCVVSVALNVLELSGRIKLLRFYGSAAPVWILLASVVVILVWLERALWTSIIRLGKKSDLLVVLGIHLSLVVGFTVAYLIFNEAPSGFRGVLFSGVRLSATYMGFIVLTKLLFVLAPEVLAVRPRRLLAVAQLSIVESTRKMWAPWVVIVIFAVILAFTHWFLPAPQQRPAELGRIFVGTLSLLCMLLLTVMVTVLAPLSLPQDIQAQTIYTVVSKPVRRLELIWGRMIGYMTIVTGLVLIFGIVSLIYLQRNIGGTISVLETKADEVRQTDPDQAKYLDDQAEQLRTRMSARVPVKERSPGTGRRRTVPDGRRLAARSCVPCRA